MALSIDWATQTIYVPKNYLTLISGTLYELDTNQFRLDLKALEASDYGITNLVTHRHNTEVAVAGVTYARVVEIISGYSVEFEDGQYSVRLKGSNNNIFDVQNGILQQNQVQVISNNSAGLQTVVSGSGVTQQDKEDIIQGVWSELKSSYDTTGTFGYYLDAPVSSAGGGSLTEESIADAVWNELKAGHDTTGTFGYNLDVPVSSVESNLTGDSIADSVWNELKAGHDTTGTFGYNLDVPVSSVESNLTEGSIAGAVWGAVGALGLSYGELLGELHGEALGRWVLDPEAETLTLYKEDGTTILKQFSLISTTEEVPAYVQRVPV